MNTTAVKFNKQDQPEFYKVLQKRVNSHFKENNLVKTANFNMKFKTAFMLSLYFLPFILMLSGHITTFGPMLVAWAIMGLGMTGIGLAIMHDANHGSYSKHKIVNEALGFTMNFIGGYHITWKIQHNVLHHSFTNIHEFDEDLDQKMFCMSPCQERKGFHQFQAIYATFLYSLLTFFRYLVKDFQQVHRYHKMDLLTGQGLTYPLALAQVVFYKATYLLIMLCLPLLLMDFPWTQILIGFAIMHIICSLISAFVFQLAHVLEETHFYKTDENGSVENNWAIHQLKTTANFSKESSLFSWFIGGLNYQVEHHLFPNICHVHYRQLSPIVKATATEFGLPYQQHDTFWSAMKSHFSLLHQLGQKATA